MLVTSFHREATRAEGLVPGAFAGEVREPYVVRLVEFDGKPAEVTLRVPGTIALAARPTPPGETLQVLRAEPAEAAAGPRELPWSAVRLSLRAHEIATVMLDLELGRHAPLSEVEPERSEKRPRRRRRGS